MTMAAMFDQATSGEIRKHLQSWKLLQTCHFETSNFSIQQ